jgi:hypothetical protein
MMMQLNLEFGILWLCNIFCLILDCGKCAFFKMVFKKESMNHKTMDEYNKTCEMLDTFHRTSFNPKSSSLTLILPKTFTCTLLYIVLHGGYMCSYTYQPNMSINHK